MAYQREEKGFKKEMKKRVKKSVIKREIKSKKNIIIQYSVCIIRM